MGVRVEVVRVAMGIPYVLTGLDVVDLRLWHAVGLGDVDAAGLQVEALGLPSLDADLTAYR